MEDNNDINFDSQVDKLTSGISNYIEDAKFDVVRYANQKLLERNWNIGKYIVENLQGGEKSAKYGEKILEIVSNKLTKKYGKGFSIRNLSKMSRFYSFSKLAVADGQFKLCPL